MTRTLGSVRRRALGAVGALHDRRRHRDIARARPVRGHVAVFYGHDRIPAEHERAHGGAVKFQQLQRAFPNEPRRFNVLYLGSSTRPRDSSALLRLARARRARIVLNQNGVAYPGWHGPGWEEVNAPLAEMLHAADHVIFQSAFCELSSNRFLGERAGPSEVLHNPVDTDHFRPGEPRGARLTLLVAGTHTQRHRLELALATLARIPEARLVVAGRIAWRPNRREALREAHALVAASGQGERVELTGPYTQRDAPAVFRRGEILLHPQWNDACPTTVLEALACALPVVYSASGGTPELVGDDAGIGVPAPLDFERAHPPAAEDLAAGVRTVVESLADRRVAARERALKFDLRPWLARHRTLFEELVR